MNARRLVLMITLFGVAATALLLSLVGNDHLADASAVVSALAAVAALGVAAWAALPGRRAGGIRVSDTGPAEARGSGSAVSGVTAPAGRSGEISVRGTGRAEAADGGEATSGVRLS
ncbi:hypothetical protein QEZ54_06850 [Catellatospora sp. KI3]|uniref:hypothetical protein n=1 Tax=Catellatospora sp. KI3 TaxID=3041620 RepID=UPI002482380C|nr:hypothetical protein [Catellatospora sp. KI3]MDI1460677.1 hypothetical protein [Catellatospora sp. KI3]